jgi:hypothetical protein
MIVPRAWTRLAFFAGCAIVAASDKAIQLLHAQGWWFLLAAAVLSVPWPFLDRKRLISTEAACEANGVVFALGSQGVQYDSHFALLAGMPYAVRVVVLFGMLLLWSWLGRSLCALFAPETEEERARP